MVTPRCCGMSCQRARVSSTTCCTRSLSLHGRQHHLRFALPIELAHARHRGRDIGDGALDDLQLSAPGGTQVRFALEQRIRVQRDRRDRVVDVVRDAARHLPERAQAFLLHGRGLRVAQVFIRGLQRAVELGVLRGERHVFAQLREELALGRAEAVRRVARRDQHAENLALDEQRHRDHRAQRALREPLRKRRVHDQRVGLVDELPALPPWRCSRRRCRPARAR